MTTFLMNFTSVIQAYKLFAEQLPTWIWQYTAKGVPATYVIMMFTMQGGYCYKLGVVTSCNSS